MATMKVSLHRKIYLGRYESKLFSIEIEREEGDDYQETYCRCLDELDELLEIVAKEYKEKHESSLDAAEKERSKTSTMVSKKKIKDLIK